MSDFFFHHLDKVINVSIRGVAAVDNKVGVFFRDLGVVLLQAFKLAVFY